MNATGDEDEGWELQGVLSDFCSCCAFQVESAPETGYLHFQGYLELVNRNTHVWIQNKLKEHGFHFQFLQRRLGSAQKAWAYSTKDETRVLGPWLHGDIDESSAKKDTTYEEALAASSIREGLAIVKSKRPRDYCLYGSTIERNLASHHVKPFIHKYQITQFNREPLFFTTSKSFVVYGDSNTGKTSFVLAHFKNPLVVTHIDSLKKLSPDNDAIVFDDMSFQHWAPESVIHLVDVEIDRDIHVRYGTAHVPAGTLKVFTHNRKNIFYKDDISTEQKIAIDRRVEYFHVTDKLYGKTLLRPESFSLDLTQDIIPIDGNEPVPKHMKSWQKKPKLNRKEHIIQIESDDDEIIPQRVIQVNRCPLCGPTRNCFDCDCDCHEQ